MRIFIISAVCLVAALRLFCSVLLKDKTFLRGDSKPVITTAVCCIIAGAGGSALGGYLCINFFGGLANSTMLTVLSAIGAAVLGIGTAFAARKLYKTETIYLPAIILLPVLCAIMTAMDFSGNDLESLLINAAIACVCFAATVVIWHGIMLNAKSLKFPLVFEAVSVAAALTAVLGVI